jgi:L-ascorbate metabolism protein UlaG (beta-lactamase superfamily)
MVSVLGYPEDQVIYGGNVGDTIDLPKAGAKVQYVNAVHGPELTVLMIKEGPTIYHTGDTDVIEDMKLIPMFHNIDVMLACIGGYFTMDPERAALAVEWVKPTHVIPMHFRTFKLLTGTPDQFRAALTKRKLADKLIVMKPGENHSF